MNNVDWLLKFDELSYAVKDLASIKVTEFVNDYLSNYVGSTELQTLLVQRDALRKLRKLTESRQESIYMFSYEMYNLLLIEIDNRIIQIQNRLPLGMLQ